MCDTMVAVPPQGSDGPVLFAKNSDREPGESQVVEHHLAGLYEQGEKVRCTWIELPQVKETHEVVLSRPAWMWGAEMGANAHGLTIGNEAVFTRVPVAKTGLTGMDLLRLALERCKEAREALDFMTYLLGTHEQGGRCGYRNESFRYHSSFVIADPSEAWILETAGRFWVARRVRQVATISNVLSIQEEFDLISDDAFAHARDRGWCSSSKDFGFARCYGDRLYRVLTGGEQRRACTLGALGGSSGRPSLEQLMAALRDHGGHAPRSGLRMTAPCAHASWLPTRHAGQTTGSMVSRLSSLGSMHWLTGTSSPCLSVFKPVVLTGERVDTGPSPGSHGYDGDSLFWQHELLHRRVLLDYEKRETLFRGEREALESLAFLNPEDGDSFDFRDRTPSIEKESDGPDEGDKVNTSGWSARNCSDIWQRHRDAVSSWKELACGQPGSSLGPLARAWWRRQDVLDGVPK